MRKKLGTFLLTCCMTISLPALVNGDTVDLTVVNNDTSITFDGDLSDAFSGIMPGGTETVVISLTNNGSQTGNYYMTQSTLETLEETSSGSGGAYAYTVTVGSSEEDATVLLDTSTGGYTEADTASGTDLSSITELNGYTYFATLAPGESTNVYMTLTLDGEGFDSVTDNDYSNSSAAISVNFRVQFESAQGGTTTVVTRYVEQTGANTFVNTILEEVIPLAGGVQTGDPFSIGVLALLLGGGIFLIVIAVKKQMGEQTHEEKIS